MQGENRRKPHSPDSESPHAGAAHHVCHSCGWAFPNPHPSAKQRRAHRKHCGKIDGFPLVSPHGDDDGNNYEDGGGGGAAAHGGETSDVHPYPQKTRISSMGDVETRAMDVGNVEAMCGTEEGMKTLGSVEFRGDDAVVICEGNAELPSEATAASPGDNDLKVSNLPCEKDIREVDVVNVVEQLENGKQLEEATSTCTYASDMKRVILAVELTDDVVGSISVLTTQCLLNYSSNEICAKAVQNVLDESAEVEPILEKSSWEKNNVDLETPPTESICNDCMDAELKSLNKDNFAEGNALSNLANTFSEEVASTNSDMVEKKNIFDGTEKEHEDDCSSSAFQVLQNVHEENNSELNLEVCEHQEQLKSITSLLPPDNEAILSPEHCLRDPDLRGTLSDGMLTESGKDNASKDCEVCKSQGLVEPGISQVTLVVNADFKPEDSNIYPGLAEIGSDTAAVKSEENSVAVFSRVQLHERNLELEGEGSNNIANNSDENGSRTDGGSEVKECIKEINSGLSRENIQGVGDPTSGELVTFTFTMKDQPLHNLIRGLEESVSSLDHVEENIECISGNKRSLSDMEHLSGSEETTVDNGSTYGPSNLPIQGNKGKLDSCIIIPADTKNSSDDARYCEGALSEMIGPESTSIISDAKSLSHQDSGDTKVQENQELAGFVTLSNESSQPSPPIDMRSKNHGFTRLEESLMDSSLCAISTEVEDCQSVIDVETEPRSNITEVNQYSQVEPGRNELENGPQLMHEWLITDTSASITKGTSSNVSNLNLRQEYNQNELCESPTELTCGGDCESVAGETDFQTKPCETHAISEKPDKEETLNLKNEVQLSHQSVGIPTEMDMVSLPETFSGIQHSVPLEEPNRNGEIASNISQQPDKQADMENDQGDTRYYCEALKETINPESASDICLKSPPYQDLEENKMQRNLKSTESVAVSNEDFQACPPIDVGNHYHGFIHLEAWIDHCICADSNEQEMEGGHSTMQTESETRSYTVEEKLLANMALEKNELEKEPQVTHVLPILDTSTSIIEGASGNLESLSSMSNLKLQESTQNQVHESLTEPTVNGDYSSVAGENHSQSKTSEAHSLGSNIHNQENTLDLQNNKAQLTYQPVKDPIVENMVSPPHMLSGSGMQSFNSLEDLNRNGEVSSSICYPSDDQTDHSILKQQETAIFSAQEALMDSISQTDSIEGHWGSVSDGMALSARDAIHTLQGLDTEALSYVQTKRSEGIDELSLVKRAVAGEQCVAGGGQLSTEMESLQGPQKSSSCTPETQVAPESQERKKKEESIAKVESWSSGKQHTPLKTLLVEANHESKHKTQISPLLQIPFRSHRSQALLNEGLTTGIPAPISEHATETSARKEIQREWNSPARLPVNKNDKRKAKGKPQWVPFLCCPSLN